ncbi:MAG: DUF2779 domain-containing protein, partial [Bdellovibrionota bacterium]
GILIDADYREPERALAQTKTAIESGTAVLFEAAFLYQKTLVRVDILVKNADGSWDLIEVKSSTQLKEEHLSDVAIQRYVLEGNGLRFNKTWVMHLNRACKYPKLENLFSKTDCTAAVEKRLSLVSDTVDKLTTALAAPHPPSVPIGPYCDSPRACAFKSTCWAGIPEHSVFELHGAWASTKFKLYSNGIVRISEIPVSQKVPRSKAEQLQAVRTGKPVLDATGLAAFLASMQYPIYFLDFETIGFAIPRHGGMAPYDQLPFQYSCHVLESPDGSLRHCEYLAEGNEDCREDLAKRLISDLGSMGTIVAFNQGFEKARLAEMAEFLPELSVAVEKVLGRFVDLKDAFTKYYYHPDFHGSFSLKEVLPALVPQMSYSGMSVSDGVSAQAAFAKLQEPSLSASQREEVRKGLLEYCKQDTLAMVELLRVLQDLVT